MGGLEPRLRATFLKHKKTNFQFIPPVLKEILLKTRYPLLDLSCLKKRSAADDELAELSKLSLLSALHLFPFIGVHPCDGIYAIFRLEQIHTLSLGISWLLKEYLGNYPDDCQNTSNTSLTKKGFLKTLKKTKLSQFLPLHPFLREVERSSPEFQLQIDLFNDDSKA